MKSHGNAEVIDDLFFVEPKAEIDEVSRRGASRECVLWAVVLELRCHQCENQDRWRGRTAKAVASFARLKGWFFRAGRAQCPQHAGVAKKVVKYPPPTHCWCGEPVAKRARHGVGRPPTKCEKHVVRGAKRGTNCKVCSSLMVFFGTKMVGAPQFEVNVWHCENCGASRSRKKRSR